MKRKLFGYDVAETDMLLSALREENASLSTTVSAMERQMTQSAELSGKRAGELQAENARLSARVADLTRETARAEALKKELEKKNAANEALAVKLSAQESVAASLREALDECRAARVNYERELSGQAELTRSNRRQIALLSRLAKRLAGDYSPEGEIAELLRQLAELGEKP